MLFIKLENPGTLRFGIFFDKGLQITDMDRVNQICVISKIWWIKKNL